MVLPPLWVHCTWAVILLCILQALLVQVQPGMLRHTLQLSDTLLCPYSVSLTVPGGCAGAAAGGLQPEDQGYTFCRWWWKLVWGEVL